MTEYMARNWGSKGTQYPRDVHRRDCFANESSSRRPFSEAKNAPPLRGIPTPPPAPLTDRSQKALHAVRLRPCGNDTRQTVVYLSALGTENSGTWPAQRKAPRFLAPSTEDAHVSPASPPLSLPKHLQPKGIAVPDPPSGLRHKLRAFAGCRRPQTQLRCETARAKRGARGRLPAFPLTGTTPCLRRRSRVCPWVSVCRGGTLGGGRAREETDTRP